MLEFYLMVFCLIPNCIELKDYLYLINLVKSELRP